MNKQKGFALVEILLVLIVVAIIGALGYTMYNQYVVKPSTDTTTANVQPKDALPEVKNGSDLTKAETAINNIDIDKAVDTSAISETLQ